MIQANNLSSVVIENLNVEGNITADRYIGGIIGYVYNNEERTITIENCSFNGNITSTNTEANESYEGRASTGGIIGAIDGYDGNVYIVNCQNSGSVKSSNYMLGGIVGYVSDGNIIDCKNTATVNIARNDQRYAGGIAGYANGDVNIVKCSNTGDVTINRGGNGCASWYAGGILGQAYTGSLNIIGCFNTAQIFAQTYEAGIVADDGDNIISCYNVGNINDSGAFGSGYWATIANGVTTGNANYYGGFCTGDPHSSNYNGEAFSTDDYTDEIAAMNTAIQEYAANCQDELIKSYLSALKYKLNEDEATKGTMPLIFE